MSRSGGAQGRSVALALALGAAWLWSATARAQGAVGLDAPGDSASASGAASPSTTYAGESAALLEPVLLGVDPVLASHVSQGLAQAASDLGYAEVPAAQVAQAAERVGMVGYPVPADLWRTVYASGAQAGLAARVWAERGYYVIEVQAALLDGRGPFSQRRGTDHTQFLATLDALVHSVLPAAGTGGAPQLRPARPVAPPGGDVFEPRAGDRAAAVKPQPPLRRIGLAVSTESAIGLGGGGFYNHLFGARLDVRLTHEIALGAYAGYVNLDGYQGRAHNVLGYLQIEDRVRVSQRSKLRVPLRFAAGFLPRNGAVIRIAAGLALPLSDRFELGVDLLAPTIWILPEGEIATSLNLAFEVIFSP